MDESRFDDLARVLGAFSGRRRAVAALLGGALGLPGLAGATAAKSGKCQPDCGECEDCDKGKCKKKKNGKKSCKKGTCQPKENGAACAAPSGGSCQEGACTCAAGQTDCGGVCGDLQTDERNCGACGVACGVNQVCQAGRCFPKGSCPANTTNLCDTGVPVFCSDIEKAVCVCEVSTEGNAICVSFRNLDCPPQSVPCNTSADCPADSACVDVSGCDCGPGVKVCAPECPAPDLL